MKTKHFFVAVLDVNELFPFSVVKTVNFEEGLKKEEETKKALALFVDNLEKHFKQKIYYMGMDVIEAKYYERFIFAKNGFLEIMMDKPAAVNAHFTEEKEAKKFCDALKKTLGKILPDTPVSQMFIDSIEVQNEKEQSFTYDTWNKLKNIRNE